MKPQYITLVGTTPKVVPLDNNMVVFNVAIRAPAGATVEVALEDPADLANNIPNSGSPGPTWVAAPAAAANGVINLVVPARLVRITPTGNGTATILQQGLR